MEISLDNAEIDYLKRKLGADTWWVAAHILDKIRVGEELEASRRDCKHEWGSFAGNRTACIHCGSWPEGHGESWKLLKKKPKI